MQRDSGRERFTDADVRQKLTIGALHAEITLADHSSCSRFFGGTGHSANPADEDGMHSGGDGQNVRSNEGDDRQAETGNGYVRDENG